MVLLVPQVSKRDIAPSILETHTPGGAKRKKIKFKLDRAQFKNNYIINF